MTQTVKNENNIKIDDAPLKDYLKHCEKRDTPMKLTIKELFKCWLGKKKDFANYYYSLLTNEKERLALLFECLRRNIRIDVRVLKSASEVSQQLEIRLVSSKTSTNRVILLPYYYCLMDLLFEYMRKEIYSDYSLQEVLNHIGIYNLVNS